MKNQVILKTIKHVKAVIKTSKDASERAGGGSADGTAGTSFRSGRTPCCSSKV